jgi:chromosome segregation ATPase
VDEVVADLRNQLAESERLRQTHQTKIVELEEALRLLRLENRNHENHYNSYFEDQVSLTDQENQLAQQEEQIRQLQDQLRIRTQEMEDLQLRMDLLQREYNQCRATPLNLNRLHEALEQMNQQLLRSQAYNQQQFNDIRFYQRDNHETEIIHLRRVEEGVLNLLENENNRPQQGNRGRRENMLPLFFNLLQQILELVMRLDRD